jgi:hypothetical protein
MIRHIIAAIATLLALWAFWFMAQLDQKAERYRQITELIERTKMEVPAKNQAPAEAVATETIQAQQSAAKAKDDEAAKKLKALRERAGSAMAFTAALSTSRSAPPATGSTVAGSSGPS